VTGWRTGCGIVRNFSSVRFEVAFPWPQWVGGDVEATGTHTFLCNPIFWECHDDPAIREWATRFRSVTTGPDGRPQAQDQFYMFMDRDTYITWTPMANPSHADRRRTPPAGRRYGCVDVHINEGGPGDFFPTLVQEW
jgi:hypothetical protein